MLTASHRHCLHCLEQTRHALACYRAALEAIRGALRLEAALCDPEVREVLLGEVREIVEGLLHEDTAANDREGRNDWS